MFLVLLLSGMLLYTSWMALLFHHVDGIDLLTAFFVSLALNICTPIFVFINAVVLIYVIINSLVKTMMRSKFLTKRLWSKY